MIINWKEFKKFILIMISHLKTEDIVDLEFLCIKILNLKFQDIL